jgi:hypothetical protein
MVSISKGGSSGPNGALYRKILHQAGCNRDGFCIPPRRGRWLLSQPGGSKFAANKEQRTGLKSGLSIMQGMEGPPETGRP